MDLQTLSSLDDLLSDVLLDGVHLWFQTHKMSKDYKPLCLPQETILRIIQKRVIIDRRVPDAVEELLKYFWTVLSFDDVSPKIKLVLTIL